MKKWKIISLLLFAALVVFGYQWVSGKIEAQKEVSRYVSLVNGWNEEQQTLQLRYKDEVLNEEEPETALKNLRSILDSNEELLRKTEQFKTDYAPLTLTAVHYQKALHSISDAYQTFYYAMETNEKEMLHDGEEALESADGFFLKHQSALEELAKENFIQLK